MRSFRHKGAWALSRHFLLSCPRALTLTVVNVVGLAAASSFTLAACSEFRIGTFTAPKCMPLVFEIILSN
jgi:hypothetical protein